MTIRPPCWGIGLGRTGTNSFCDALRVLGYERIGHNPPWQALRTLEGGADTGVLLFYKYLDHRFPGSKFVLTVRDLDTWLESAKYVVERCTMAGPDTDTPIMRRMMLYETVTFDRDKYIAAYHRHHADVRRYFAGRGDLLEMNITAGDGWYKLCPFLGLEVPDAPFPRSHVRPVEVA